MIWFERARWISLGVALVLTAATFARVSAAVTVSSFTAQAQGNQIVLNWKTKSETNNSGFNLYRSTSPSGPWTTKINKSIIPVCPVCLLVGGDYSQSDTAAASGQKYYYRLESVETSGSTQFDSRVPSAQISASAPTATSSAPTATRTTTPAASATATSTTLPGTVTPTVYRSPTPLGTPPPTATPFPTRIAYVVGQPSPTLAQPNARVNAPPISNPQNPVPPVARVPEIVVTDPSLTDAPTEPADGPAAPSARALPDLFTLGLFALASLFTVTGLAIGAVSLYLIARQFGR